MGKRRGLANSGLRARIGQLSDHEDEPLEEPEPPDITIPPEWVPGAYANYAMVAYTSHEFTLDFVRMDPYHNEGVVVARISCPSQTANDLMLMLADQLRLWAAGVMSDLGGGDGNGQTHYRPGDPGPEDPEEG